MLKEKNAFCSPLCISIKILWLIRRTCLSVLQCWLLHKTQNNFWKSAWSCTLLWTFYPTIASEWNHNASCTKMSTLICFMGWSPTLTWPLKQLEAASTNTAMMSLSASDSVFSLILPFKCQLCYQSGKSRNTAVWRKCEWFGSVYHSFIQNGK